MSDPLLIDGSPPRPTEGAPSRGSGTGVLDRLRHDRDWQTKAAAGVGLVALGVAASDDEGTVLCPFRRCTDGYCPFCGATRSFGRLLRGDIAGAWARHPYVVLLAAQVAVLGALFAFTQASARTRSTPLLSRRQRNGLLIANGVFVVGLWVARMVTGDIPRPSTLTFFGF